MIPYTPDTLKHLEELFDRLQSTDHVEAVNGNPVISGVQFDGSAIMLELLTPADIHTHSLGYLCLGHAIEDEAGVRTNGLSREFLLTRSGVLGEIVRKEPLSVRPVGLGEEADILSQILSVG